MWWTARGETRTDTSVQQERFHPLGEALGVRVPFHQQSVDRARLDRRAKLVGAGQAVDLTLAPGELRAVSRVDRAKHVHAELHGMDGIALRDVYLDHRNRLPTELVARVDGSRGRLEGDAGQVKRVELRGDGGVVSHPGRADESEGVIGAAAFRRRRALEEHRAGIEELGVDGPEVWGRIEPGNTGFVEPHGPAIVLHRHDMNVRVNEL